jgi:hypothetical protein
MPCGCAFQITLNADGISPNTPEAVMIRAIAPATEVKMPLDVPDALWMMFLHETGARVAHQITELDGNRAARCVLAEGQPGDGDHL